VAQAPLDRPITRPTDAPPLAHEASAPVPDAAAPEALLPAEELPRHVAIIMDGNRRWAAAHGVTDFEGHAAGMEAVRRVIGHAVRRGIPMLTLYAFSRENWARSDEEVAGLFDLLGRAIANETDELRAQGARVQVLGRLEELPADTRAAITEAVARTADGSRLHLNIAWNYAGRTEIVDAVRRIAASGATPEQIDERTVSDALYTGGLPDPDVLVRTGGEQRISNFLIWQCAYAELVFTDCLWPDFGHEQFDAAVLEFARRTRRYGR
jgi:undecaprenyl diphosphate synthase